MCAQVTEVAGINSSRVTRHSDSLWKPPRPLAPSYQLPPQQKTETYHHPKSVNLHIIFYYMDIPRHTVAGEFLESINHNGPNFRWILSLSVAKSGTNVEHLIIITSV